MRVCSEFGLFKDRHDAGTLLAQRLLHYHYIVVLHQSERFFGIGQFYEQFPQVEGDDVIECLNTVREFHMPNTEN